MIALERGSPTWRSPSLPRNGFSDKSLLVERIGSSGEVVSRSSSSGKDRCCDRANKKFSAAVTSARDNVWVRI